jgi:hypothetical protein
MYRIRNFHLRNQNILYVFGKILLCPFVVDFTEILEGKESEVSQLAGGNLVLDTKYIWGGNGISPSESNEPDIDI